MAEPKLSLALRKNIRDNEEKLKAATAKLTPFAGGDVTVEVDWAKFAEVLGKDKSYENRAGEAIEWIVKGLAERWESNFGKNDEFKATVAKAWTTKKLIVRAVGYKRESGGEYHKVSLENGTLVIDCAEGSVVSNVGEVGQKADKTLGLVTDAGYNLSLSKNVRENAPKIEAKIKEITDATGVTGIAFPLNYNEIDAWMRAADKNSSSYYDRSAEIGLWVIGGLADNLKKLCKDDMVKEALQEVWKGQIVLTVADPKLGSSHETEFKDGKMILKYRSIISNVAEVGKDIEKRL